MNVGYLTTQQEGGYLGKKKEVIGWRPKRSKERKEGQKPGFFLFLLLCLAIFFQVV